MAVSDPRRRLGDRAALRWRPGSDELGSRGRAAGLGGDHAALRWRRGAALDAAEAAVLAEPPRSLRVVG